MVHKYFRMLHRQPNHPMFSFAAVPQSILADFGGLGVLLLGGMLLGSLALSIGVTLFDRRLFQFVLAAISCLLFCAFCIAFGFAILHFLVRGRATDFPFFVLIIPPITTVQFIFYGLKQGRRSRR